MKHHARTAEQIANAAKQGTQYPCNTIANHQSRNGSQHTCPTCQALRQAMTDAYQQGYREAQERALLLDPRTISQEISNAVQAYCDLPPIEPAVSYTVGYTGGLEAVYIAATCPA